MANIEDILNRSAVIAVVGLSDRPDRPSHRVARYMQEQGYRVIPVNPVLSSPVLGEPPYPDLESVPVRVDIVDIFRRPEHVPAVVDAAREAGVRTVWMQLGIFHEAAADAAASAGIDVVMDRCIKVEHERLCREGKANSR